MGVYVSIVDVREAIIPRQACWTGGGAVLALLAAAAGVEADPLRLAWAAVGAVSVGLVLELVYRFQPGKIGFGDVRLIIVNALLAGWWGIPWAWWALCAGALAEWPIAIFAVIRHGRKATVRWAPGLVVGTGAVLVYLLWAEGPTG